MGSARAPEAPRDPPAGTDALAAAQPGVRLALLGAIGAAADEIIAALLDAPGSPIVAVGLDGDDVRIDVRPARPGRWSSSRRSTPTTPRATPGSRSGSPRPSRARSRRGEVRLRRADAA